jgi:V8-like Glu-specific endopeptidase
VATRFTSSAVKSFDLNDLSGPQRAVLRAALVSAFGRRDLDKMLQDNDVSKRLEILVRDGTLETEVFELVLRSQQEGWTDRLVTWAQNALPNHPRIKNLISELGMLDGVEGDLHLVNRSLEQTVKARSDALDFDEWLVRFTQIRRAVCRIEDTRDSRKAIGTGFLVGPDLLLTNFHVMENYLGAAPKMDTTTLAFRFDYAIDTVGENFGKTVGPNAADWLVSSASYSSDPEAATDLDYTLIRLMLPVGEDVLDGVRRGWLELSSLVPSPKANEVVFIAQHPKGTFLKMAVGTVLAPRVGEHVRYDTETQGGSSGSPCLDASLQLVAIHQGSNSDRPREVPYNEGILVDAIIEDLAANGVTKFWT